MTNKALGFEVPAERERMAGYGTLAATMDALEEAVSAGPYVAGDRFSAADVYVGSQINFGLMFGSIEKRPAFEAYRARIAERPALKRANALDDAAMPPKGS